MTFAFLEYLRRQQMLDTHDTLAHNAEDILSSEHIGNANADA